MQPQPRSSRPSGKAPAQSESLPALFVANALWLDFVNTRYIQRGSPIDVLTSFTALVDWLVEAGTLPAESRDFLPRQEGTPEGARVFDEALALRDALRELAELLSSRSGLPEERPVEESGDAAPAVTARAAEAINEVLRADVCYDELAPMPDSAGNAAPFMRHARRTDDNLLRILAPVAYSASEVLCGVGDPSLVKRCGNPRCVLYFYDTTRNRHRRFCSPATCGNRVKAAARYRRTRASGRPDSAE